MGASARIGGGWTHAQASQGATGSRWRPGVLAQCLGIAKDCTLCHPVERQA